LPKAVHQLLQQVVPRRAPLAVQQAQTDESELPHAQAQPLPVKQAWCSVALQQAQEPASSAPLQSPSVLLEHSALPQAQLELRARSVSALLAPH